MVYLFLAEGFAQAVPGIVIQLILIPTIMAFLSKKDGKKMIKVAFPYGKETIEHSFSENELLGVLESSINTYSPNKSGEELVKEAMESPVGSAPLSELARGKKNVVIIQCLIALFSLF